MFFKYNYSKLQWRKKITIYAWKNSYSSLFYKFLKDKKFDWEIIVVNDASKDRTTEVALSFSENIKVIEYIFFLDIK